MFTLSPTLVSHSNCRNIQSISVLPLPTVDHSVVDRRNEERSKEYLRRRKLEENKKGKSIAFDHEDQDRSVNVKRRKFIEVASQKSKLKDRGIYVALFAERFICGSNVVDNECDVNTHRIKFGSLLWKYGKMKLEKHITSES
ncbi:hypothetical protein KY285_019200 [Solanum tuberosum]|nr:hypothetical protein KY285_019200 [Solanum tuberosum]